MWTALVFALLGYLSGSVLFVHVWDRLLKKGPVVERSQDQNPGTANAFQYGGFWCGCLTLIGDISKGFLPVWAYFGYSAGRPLPIWGTALVVAAPAIGHAFPLFYSFKGGKAIAVSFGCLLGLLPVWRPLAALVFSFLLFSLVIKIYPHSYRTGISFFVALILCWGSSPMGMWLGFLGITLVVCLRLLLGKEDKERIRVKLLWMH